MKTDTTEFRLILTHAAWSAAMRSLLLDPNLCAISSLKWNNKTDRSELLTHQLEIVPRWPAGEDRLPLTDWLVMAVQHDSQASSLDILKQIKPRQSQTVVLLRFFHENRQQWEGIVHREGEIILLDEIRIVGSGMLQLNSEPSPKMLQLPVEGRWSRTIGALGSPLWNQVHQSNILLIGCGRNGTLAAWQFAGLGVERMSFVDADLLKIENLDAMPGLSLEDVGQPKTTALAQRLIAYNDQMTIRCYKNQVNEILDQLRSRFDLIVTCVDSDTPRIAASWLSRELLVPHLDIGTSVQQIESGRQLAGDVRLLLPFEGCVCCVGGLQNPEATQYEFAAPPGSLHRGKPLLWHEQRVGSLIHLNAMTVGTALEIWLACLQGNLGSFWQRLTWNNKTGLQAEGAEVARDANCPYCGL